MWFTMVVFRKFVLLLTVLRICDSKQTFSVDELVVVIINQVDQYHAVLAHLLQKDILQQGHDEYGKSPIVTLSSELTKVGDWTLLSLVSPLLNLYPDARWFFLCIEHTTVRLTPLLKLLHQHNYDKEIFLGHPLTDSEPTIIHHFSPDRRVYPNIASGIAFSKVLLQRLDKHQLLGLTPPGDFTIDPAYELTVLLESLVPPVKLTSAPRMLCTAPHLKCASFPTSLNKCGDPIDENTVLFAVKTCAKYHDTRVKIVMNTWGKYVSNMIFYTDKNDGRLANIHLDTLNNVKHVESGHCEKLQGILQRAHVMMQQNSDIKWLVVADDDTILGVSRLCEMLSCFGDGTKVSVAIGERYGYGYNRKSRLLGYDYLTGGGGIVLSSFTVRILMTEGKCPACPSPLAPDDMWLGSCLRVANIPVTHSWLFHQARPVDYPSEYLSPHRPVSFHKHWLIDPSAVYKDWFLDDDSSTFKIFNHSEL